MQLAHSGPGIHYWENPGAFYVTAMVKSNFSEKDQKTYWQIVTMYDNCFQLAKQNKIPEAQKEYEACCTVSKETGHQLMDWILAFYGQRLCYYYYKIKKYNNGIALTMKIIESVRLLQQSGHQYLFFVEIQQQLNLSRIYFELNETTTAISLCTNCIINMYQKAGVFSNLIINGVPENELIEITRYGMIIEVLSEACNKILFKLKEDPDELEKSVIRLIEPLLSLDFSLLSSDPRYTCIDKFISLMSGLGGYSELQDDDILFFMNSQHANKKLLKVLNNYIALIEA